MVEKQIRITGRTLLIAAGGLLAAGLLVVGLRNAGTLFEGRGSGVRPAAKNIGAATAVNQANFNYLVPPADAAWKYDGASLATDDEKGIVRYQVHMKYAGADITFSQQRFPADLGHRKTDKFTDFIGSQHVVLSQEAGAGTVYYKSALKNGAAVSSADTVIYATDDILMFGRSNTLLGYDAWAKLLTAMKPSR